MHNRTTNSFDGVPISYSVSGTADTALLFIHGGLADRSFWTGQYGPFEERFKVVALDLAGHGDSGRDRPVWGIPQFAQDVLAVVAAEHPAHTILIGNSLGGSVAIEAAALMGGAAIGVVGVDTFHDMGRRIDPDEIREQADAWRRDFNGQLDRMLHALFHPDASTGLVTEVRRRMCRTTPDTVARMFASFGGYDTGASARLLRVAVRCINGALFPTKIDAIRRVIPDFDAIVLPHTGHFPMLECPVEFNQRLAEVVAGIMKFQP